MSLVTFIGVLFIMGILTSPAIAYFSILKLRVNIGIKILCWVILTILLAIVFIYATILVLFGNDLHGS